MTEIVQSQQLTQLFRLSLRRPDWLPAQPSLINCLETFLFPSNSRTINSAMHLSIHPLKTSFTEIRKSGSSRRLHQIQITHQISAGHLWCVFLVPRVDQGGSQSVSSFDQEAQLRISITQPDPKTISNLCCCRMRRTELVLETRLLGRKKNIHLEQFLQQHHLPLQTDGSLIMSQTNFTDFVHTDRLSSGRITEEVPKTVFTISRSFPQYDTFAASKDSSVLPKDIIDALEWELSISEMGLVFLTVERKEVGT